MANAGDSWYPALLGLADSFRQANNIKVRTCVRIITRNTSLSGVCSLSERSVQFQSSRPDLCQNSPPAGLYPAHQDRQSGPGQAASLPGLESQSEPPGRGGDQTGGCQYSGQDSGHVRRPDWRERHPAVSSRQQPGHVLLALQTNLPACISSHLSVGL